MQRASTQMRIWFVFFSILIWLGMYLTGFENIHWFLYVPSVALILAAITGICPSQILVNNLFSSKK
jgi:hypothetical protein